jgi:hypothetical protein
MRTIPGKSEFEPPPSKADFLTSPQRQFPTNSGHFTPIPTVESVLLVINAMLNIARELWAGGAVEALRKRCAVAGCQPM